MNFSRAFGPAWTVLILGLAGCSGLDSTPPIEPTIGNATVQPSTPAPSQVVQHPSGPTDIVLRMSVIGGLRYPGATVEPPPAFTLYGDGRVIYTIDHSRPDDGPAIELRQARLTEEQIAALVNNALGPGGLASARDRYADVPMADDVTTVFEVHGHGIDKTVSVYALGYTGDEVPDPQARTAFRALAEGLRNFGAEVAAGNAEDLGPFVADRYLVTLDQPFGELQVNRDWPWDDLSPEDFSLEGSYLVRVVTASQATAIHDPPTSAPNDLLVAAPDGNDYLMRVRALLPDEIP